MAFLPLAGCVRAEENCHMHPYAIDRIVEERRQELYRLSRLDSARPGTWRTTAGRALVAMAVRLGVPQGQRTTARDRAVAVLGFDSPC